MGKYGKTHRINIQILDSNSFIENHEIETVKLAIKKSGCDNVALVISIDAIYNGLLDTIKRNHIPFFFLTRVSDYDTLQGLLSYHPISIHITNDLGFDLDTVKKIVKNTDPNIEIRAFANLSQSSWPQATGIKTFFIRPEDIKYYSKWIDVFEFFWDYKQQNVLFSVWAHDKHWFGKLNEIITGYEGDLDNTYLINQNFASSRVNCRKKCMRGGRCRICSNLEELAKEIKENPNYEILRRKGN